MRATLDFDDDVFAAVKEIADRESKTMGTVASELIRASLTAKRREDVDSSADEFEAEFGFRPFTTSKGIVTDELVNRLRNEVGDL